MEFDVARGAQILTRTPALIRVLLEGLDPAWSLATEGPDTWSPYDVVGHLLHGERTDWIPRARLLLAGGENRRFEPFDRLAQFRESEGRSLDDLLDAFSTVRQANVATLSAWQLTDAQLGFAGEHPELGVVTLRQLLATWVAHDLSHIAHISRVMAGQYRDAVGPWRRYLSIVDRQ